MGAPEKDNLRKKNEFTEQTNERQSESQKEIKTEIESEVAPSTMGAPKKDN